MLRIDLNDVYSIMPHPLGLNPIVSTTSNMMEYYNLKRARFFFLLIPLYIHIYRSFKYLLIYLLIVSGSFVYRYCQNSRLFQENKNRAISMSYLALHSSATYGITIYLNDTFTSSKGAFQGVLPKTAPKPLGGYSMQQYIKNPDAKIPLRSKVAFSDYKILSVRKTAHIDIWLVQDFSDDRLYFVMELRAGGWEPILERTVFLATELGLFRVGSKPEISSPMYSNGPTTQMLYPWVHALHDKYIQPWVRNKPYSPHQKFVGPPSVRLHYIYIDPGVNDPFEGVVNHYGHTARAARDVELMAPARKAEAKQIMALENMYAKSGKAPDRAMWSAKERSVLRTLGKMLRPSNERVNPRTGKTIKKY